MVWADIFSSSGRTYQPAHFVLFTGSTASGCGGANAQVGPHYFPLNKTIYVDRDFYGELERRFGASGGDFAETYVMAHEVAHHVPNELGIMDDVRSAQQSDPDQASDYSVSLELQAECLAGVWAYSIFQQGDVLERGDIERHSTLLRRSATIASSRQRPAG